MTAIPCPVPVRVGHYLTATGKDGVVIWRDTRGRYNYSGAWGAGSGHSRETMCSFLNGMLRDHKRHSIAQAFTDWNPAP